MIKNDIVLTSINNNNIFRNYYSNLKKFNNLENTRIIFVTDKKTPNSCYEEYKKFSKKGLNIVFFDLEKQEKFLKKLSANKFFPYNSDNRRNIGYLYSYSLNDSETLISIDDDNFAKKEYDFIGGHNILNKDKNYKLINSNINWFNNCDTLKFSSNLKIFPRGYPLEERKYKSKYTYQYKNVKIGVNGGMWLNAPDIDAITWLNSSPKSISLKKNRYVLSKNTWCPINSQNTSLIKEAIPSYFFLKMNYLINNQIIDRFGDIFSGYFLQKCIKHMNHYVSFGLPLVDHNRNSHNFIKDAQYEWNCLILCNKLLKYLLKFEIEGKTYSDCYFSLAKNIEEISKENVFHSYEKNFLSFSIKDMKFWIKLCKKIR